MEMIIIQLVVLSAAVLQAALGVGFGVLAGPILLLYFKSVDAVFINILLNLLIAGVLAPRLQSRRAVGIFPRLAFGTLVGLPCGVWILNIIEFNTLQFIAGISVLLAAASIFGQKTSRCKKLDSTGLPLIIGWVAGLMGGSLGMPGPIPAGWMARRGYAKDTIRATLITLCFISYGGAILLHYFLSEIASSVFLQTLLLGPATIVGLYVGNKLIRILSEKFFRILIAIILICSAGSLFWDLL
tara:strand:+ start:3155 stop:3880 length:726 start_codon:yes stop_codon:yes gene_type:complete